MAAKKKPAKILVIRRGKTSEYDLTDDKDWSILYDTVLEIRAADEATYYWPLDSITLWKVIPQ